MTLLFIGIAVGIVIGVVGSIIVWAMPWDEQPADCDLGDLMRDITPLGTPFLSEIERHRQAHLAARKDL